MELKLCADNLGLFFFKYYLVITEMPSFLITYIFLYLTLNGPCFWKGLKTEFAILKDLMDMICSIIFFIAPKS